MAHNQQGLALTARCQVLLQKTAAAVVHQEFRSPADMGQVPARASHKTQCCALWLIALTQAQSEGVHFCLFDRTVVRSPRPAAKQRQLLLPEATK